MRIKKLLFILFLLPTIAFGQTYLQVGNTLQRAITGPDTSFRFSMGSPGYWYPPTYTQIHGWIAAGGFVPSSRTLTINGTTLDLSANRTWNVGTVTSITPGVGFLSHTPITTAGTMNMDTAGLIASKAWALAAFYTQAQSNAKYQLLSNLETTITNSSTLYPSGSAVTTGLALKLNISDTAGMLAGVVHKSGFSSQTVAGTLNATNIVGLTAVVAGSTSNLSFLSSSGLKIETGSASVYTSYEKDNIVFNDLGTYQQRFTPTSGTLAMNSIWELGNTGFARDTVSSQRYARSVISSGFTAGGNSVIFGTGGSNPGVVANSALTLQAGTGGNALYINSGQSTFNGAVQFNASVGAPAGAIYGYSIGGGANSYQFTTDGTGSASIVKNFSNGGITITGDGLYQNASGRRFLTTADSALIVAGIAAGYVPYTGATTDLTSTHNASFVQTYDTGTGGSGFHDLISQSISPASVSGHLRLYADSLNRLSWKNSIYRRTIWVNRLSDMTIKMPYRFNPIVADSTDVATSLALKLNISDTSTMLGNVVHLAKNETITGQKTFSNATRFTGNGAASAPVVIFTGSWFTGGTATTTIPQLWIQQPTAPATNWSTAGTALGVSAVTGFVGNLIDLQTNSSTIFSVSGGGFGQIASGMSSPQFNSLSLGVLTIQSRGQTSAVTSVSMSTGTWTNSSGIGVAVSIAPVGNQTSAAGLTALKINPTGTWGSGAQLLIDAQSSGTSKWKVDNTGLVTQSADLLINTTVDSTAYKLQVNGRAKITQYIAANTNDSLVAFNPTTHGLRMTKIVAGTGITATYASGNITLANSVATIHGNSTTTGTATTAVTVTIGSTMANTTYLTTITPKDLLTAVNYYISAQTTTTFTVTFVSALTGSINFDWGVTP